MDEQQLRVDVAALSRAVASVVATIETQGATLRGIEIAAATEKGRQAAIGDCATKVELATLQRAVDGLVATVDTLRRAHDQQRGVLIAISVLLPIATTLLVKWLSGHIGV